MGTYRIGDTVDWPETSAQLAISSRTLAHVDLLFSMTKVSPVANTLMNLHYYQGAWRLIELDSSGPVDKTYGAGVVLLLRPQSSRLDVFYTVVSNEIRMQQWQNDQGTWWENPNLGINQFQMGSHLAAVSRHAEHWEIFYLGRGNNQQAIMHTYKDGVPWERDVVLVKPG